MEKINFTQEHKRQHEYLAMVFLFAATVFSAVMGTTYNVYQILHNTSIKSLQTLLIYLKKEIAQIEDLDRWSLTHYQEEKLKELKEQYEFIDLTIGWKKWQAQKNADAQAIKDLKAELNDLKKSAMSPADQMKELEAKIRSLGGELPENEPVAPEAGSPLSNGEAATA